MALSRKEKGELTWKEAKDLEDASLRRRLKGFMLRPELLKPGVKFRTMDGAEYYIAPDGSRRRCP
jgi:hypothetical protein